ncbi:MAG: periplasmic binding protein, partial [Bacteroidetes bacterium]|nr:periplasmic binding protein [Bacteroidota bacterium]
YSHSFRVEYYKDHKVVKVFANGNKQPISTYVLCRKDVNLPEELKEAVRIESPVTRIVCLSTTHMGALKLLDARDLIAATANAYLIYDSAVNAMVKNGLIKDAGKDYQPSYEIIAQVKPQVLFSDGENSGSPQVNGKFRALKVSVASPRDYFEQDPLARAEWIKFFAAFIDKEKVADSIFRKVKAGYLETMKNMAETGEHPTVFCNVPFNGVWYMPCGKNYVAQLITDAGGKFLWNDDEPANGLNLTLNFEQVYGRAANADFWINTYVYTDLNELTTVDSKFKLFKAYKTGNVYNCSNRISTAGGLDMWETGTLRPDIVLSDLALVFHSHTVPSGLYYYRQLK